MLECHTQKHGGDVDMHSDDKDSQGSEAKDKDQESKQLKCDSDSGPVTELKVGTEDNQHVVAIEPARFWQGRDVRSGLRSHAREAGRHLRGTEFQVKPSSLLEQLCFEPFRVFNLARPCLGGSAAVLSNKPFLLRMDHPCHKCGQSAEDGVPFCSHCGAPQIRVAMAEPAPVELPTRSGTVCLPVRLALRQMRA